MTSSPQVTSGLDSTVDHQAVDVRVEFGALSHVGKVRDKNEDHFLVARLSKSLRIVKTNLPRGEGARLPDQEAYLLAVADGMGGAAAGERASALVIAEMERHILQTSKWFFHQHERDDAAVKRDVDHGLRWLDQIVIQEGEADWALAGMGTTLTAALSFGLELTVIHVGDSRAYLYRSGELQRITRDHTLAQLLMDGGVMSAEQAGLAKARHVLTNVLGGPSKGVFGEVHRLFLKDGDRLLLCSDGLTDMVAEAEIARLLGISTAPEATCRSLVDTALAQGGKDNVSVVLADYSIRV